MMRGQGKILSSFAVDGMPLTGWSVQPDPNNARGEIIYTTADGKFAFVGQVLTLNASGNVINEGARLQDEYGPKIDLGYVWALLAKTTFIKEGPEDNQAKVIVYGFMDPNCVYCHQSWKLLEPYTKMGLQVRWIPVGVIDPKTSKEKAAALLEAKDPLAALESAYRNWESKRGDAFEAVKAIAPVTQAKLDANSQVLAQMGARGTPAFIFKDGEGKINRIQGSVTAEHVPSIMKVAAPVAEVAPKGSSAY